MKLKFTFLLTAALLTLSFIGVSQTPHNTDVKIGELVLGRHYTEAEIEDIADAKPEVVQMGDDVTSIHRFQYKGNAFYTAKGVLHCFELSNDKLKFDGIVGIGDSLDKVSELNLILSNSADGGAGVTYHFAYTLNDTYERNPITFFVKDNVIFRITYLNNNVNGSL